MLIYRLSLMTVALLVPCWVDVAPAALVVNSDSRFVSGEASTGSLGTPTTDSATVPTIGTPYFNSFTESVSQSGNASHFNSAAPSLFTFWDNINPGNESYHAIGTAQIDYVFGDGFTANASATAETNLIFTVQTSGTYYLLTTLSLPDGSPTPAANTDVIGHTWLKEYDLGTSTPGNSVIGATPLTFVASSDPTPQKVETYVNLVAGTTYQLHGDITAFNNSNATGSLHLPGGFGLGLAAVVPEPATLALFAAGTLLILRNRRRHA